MKELAYYLAVANGVIPVDAKTRIDTAPDFDPQPAVKTGDTIGSFTEVKDGETVEGKFVVQPDGTAKRVIDTVEPVTI